MYSVQVVAAERRDGGRAMRQRGGRGVRRESHEKLVDRFEQKLGESESRALDQLHLVVIVQTLRVAWVNRREQRFVDEEYFHVVERPARRYLRTGAQQRVELSAQTNAETVNKA